MTSQIISDRCLRTKARRHYDEGEHQDDEIEGRRMFTIDDKIDSEKYTSNLVKDMDGHDLTFKFFQEHGFEAPMVFRKPDGLGIKMPSQDFGVDDVKQLIGSRRIVDCMDVTTQKAETMTMAQFQKYYQEPNRERLLNVISLEFSHTKLDDLVHPPSVVKQIDWVDTVWPRHLKMTQRDSTNALAEMKYPKIQKYCLMSVGGCYTDFHIDFGGTSVWYHILHGEKIFWLIPPTQKNLDMYQAWVLSGKQGEIFLGEKVAECCMVHLVAGNTFMIPSGWIHAVYTPADSLVFGGNILHSFAIDRQIKVNDIEDSTHVPPKFRYPFFMEINWYCLERYVHTLMGKSYLKAVPKGERQRSRKNSEEGDEDSKEGVLPSGVKIERKDSTDSDKTIDVRVKQEESEEEEEKDSDDDEEELEDDVMSNASEQSGKTEEGSRSSTPVNKPSTSQNGHEPPSPSSSHEEDTKIDDAIKEEDTGSGEASKVKSCLCTFEKRGLVAQVIALANLPKSKRFVPDMITDADALLLDAREMLKIHEGDDPLAALTGEPMLKWPKKPGRPGRKKQGMKYKVPLANRPKAKKPATGYRKRRTKCRQCDNCLRGDCRECNFCLDMKKYGGSGKMKQSCKMKRCSNPQLPSNCRCVICDLDYDKTTESENTLMECHQCNEVAHPECLQAHGYTAEGILNEDMKNSWECPKCVDPTQKDAQVLVKPECGAGDALTTEATPKLGVKRKKASTPDYKDSDSEPEITPAPKKRGRPPVSRRKGGPPLASRIPPSRIQRNGNTHYDVEDDLEETESLKPFAKRGLRGRGRLGYKQRGHRGRANMVSSHKQRVAKQKVLQAKYHSIRGAQRRERGFRKRGRPRRHSPADPDISVPAIQPSFQEDSIKLEHPKMTPLSIPALEPEVVLMEKAQPSVIPMYVVRPAPISPPPSTVTLEDETEHIITHDVWIKVFKYLLPKELCKCMRVCKTWDRWCCNPSLWRCLSIARMDPIPATALRGLVLRQPRSLDISWTNISKQHFVWLLARLPGMRMLYLHGISWDAVSALCSSICPLLHILDLRWVTGIKDSTIKRLLSPITNHRPGMIDEQCHLRFLTDLRLTGSDITDATMATLRDCTPILAKLNLQHCRKITDEGVKILAGENSPIRETLKEINLANNNNITDACILSLQRCHGLVRVVVHSCPELNRDSWNYYSSNSGVEVILVRLPRPAQQRSPIARL